MKSLMADRMHRLAETLTELKIKVRTAMATEMAKAFGAAVRDVFIVAMLDRLVTPPLPRTPTRPPLPSSHSGGWRDERSEDRNHWEERCDYREDDPDADDREPRSSSPDDIADRDDVEERAAPEAQPAALTVTAVAVGVNVGRWWLTRKGSVVAAIGVGALATALGLAGGPIARAALAILAAATDLLSADSVLSRVDPI